MKIAIDARWIFKEISGIGSYTRELIRHLAPLDQSNEYLLLFNDPVLMKRTIDETGISEVHNFRTLLFPHGLFSIRSQLQLPHLLREQHVDVYHSTNYMIPLLAFPPNRPGRVRCVTSIHDLIPLIFPKYAPRSKKARLFFIYRHLMYQVGKRADIIITGSTSSGNDLMKHLHIRPTRSGIIQVIPDGVSARYTPAVGVAGGGPKPKGPRKHPNEKIVLWVGRPDPYKNVVALVEAFARLRTQLKTPVTLRLVGPADARYPEAPRRAAELGIADSVVQVGYVGEEQLLREYQQADVFALPSFYEGFGLPVVEAMACGTPVVCSDCGSLPEVAGDAALQVKPDNPDAIADALARILTDAALAHQLRQRGIQQAATFTWSRTAQETLAAYWKALA